jgi:hypothetical protein
MMVRFGRFNIYLLLSLAACLFAGCSTPEERARKKETAALNVHLETSPQTGDRAESITVSRTSPIHLTVERDPFLSEAFVSEAKVISVMDGFAISIQFDRRGTWLLEQYSAANRGRHLAIRASFGKELAEARWLAAPRISTRIANGVLTFTPDATREEADQIVLGLNNVAKKIQDQSAW